VPGTTTGIGPALREARHTLGKSLEEASRDTKIKPDYLQALERESFDTLREDVYVRGFLRSYSAYLGLDPEKVMSAYAGARRSAGAPEDAEEPDEAQPPTQSKPIRKLHRRANWKLAFAVAAVLLVVFGVSGVLSRNQAAPDVDAAPRTGPSASAAPAGGESAALAYVYLKAKKPVDAVVIADGTRLFEGMLKPKKPQQFTAQTVVRVWFSRGGVVETTVNGHDLGFPGTRQQRYEASFTPQDYRETPSPAA
jgi:cytoskeletal protein RodZ